MDDDCEDQACSLTDVCIKSGCSRGFDARGKLIRPPLEKRGRYWCCPTCGSSYGESDPRGTNSASRSIARSDRYYYCREHDDPLGWSVRDRGTVIARGDKCLCAAMAELLNGRSDGGLLSRTYHGAFDTSTSLKA